VEQIWPAFFATEVRKTRVSQMRAYALGEHWEEHVMLVDWWAGYLNEIAAK
jgi:hypothetical protein